MTNTIEATCRHCDRRIVKEWDNAWIDPKATGDDSIWRETCDAHETFRAEHEPIPPLHAPFVDGECYYCDMPREFVRDEGHNDGCPTREVQA